MHLTLDFEYESTLRAIVVVFFLTCFGFGGNAQDMDGHDDHVHHHNHRHEIGMANAAVYFVNEEEISYGLHLHYIYNFEHSRFGVGLGYERIFDEHKHNTIGVAGSYRPVDKLVFIVSPGITFEGGESDHSGFALHLEATYEFLLNDVHLGPVIEFAYDEEDIHMSLGLHIGLGF